MSELRTGNLKMEFVRAVADIPARNVQAGKLSSVIFITKADGAADFSAPLSTKILLARYAVLGDEDPISIGD
jgi:hypothetical protein